ncbi:cytochrome P450 [Nesterenkonia halotolerans]|uniref:Cytochrome P450 n=1 Tax=Nesterenkonia halotolerans TaxID=225325 RepID=A0ABR9J767_9MICC|nr:cytochrome P450 [Nesterenkonia halotolerans]MBE1514421.1 cytochrome P450 [Nesterenkonia halotolerans]
MNDTSISSVHNPLPSAGPLETVQVLRDVIGPMVAKGPIIRRPTMVAASERLDLDGRAVSRMQTLSDKYGRGPLMLNIPGRPVALILDPGDVHRVLEGSPEPFAAEETLKRHALKHFEPKTALISDGTERAQRRRLNEKTLDHDHPVHHMAASFMPVVEQETELLLEQVQAAGGALEYKSFYDAWFRIVRRVVLGDSARTDTPLTDLMESLRRDGNWAFFKPVATRGRSALLDEIQNALDRAEPGSLAAFMTQQPQGSEAQPAQQIPQWLFAFDPAGMATFRALALLAAHPDSLRAATRESRKVGQTEEGEKPTPATPLLRSTVLESLRLWPTTPMILRETTTDVRFTHGVMPAGTSVLVFTPFFHRDDRHLDFAHRFAPELWERPRTRQDWPLVPFSAGPGLCPGRHLVLLLASKIMAELLSQATLHLDSHSLDPEKLPGLLNNFSLRFRLS